MLSNIMHYFLGAYENSTYLLNQKSRIIFGVCITILVMIPILMIVNVVQGTTFDVQIPLILGLIITVIIIVLLKGGYFSISAHLMLIVVLFSGWGTMFFDTDKNAIVVMDTIVFMPGLLVLTSLAITKRKSAILLYTAGNIFVFIIFVLIVKERFKIADDVLLDYIADSIISMIIAGLLAYFIHRINHNAVELALKESDKNEEQYHLIRNLQGSIIQTSEKLTAHSWDLTMSADSFSEQSQSQASAIEELTATSEEVSGGIDLVSNDVARQYDSLHSFLGNIETLTTNISQIAERILRALSLTDEVSDVANRGGNALSAMSQSLTTVNESSGRMTGIVGMIGDISDKTNLLSLNAAIEAARAGEAGRGFAVVADEISKLADQTAASIKEIDGLIKANVEEIGRGMGNIEMTVTTIMQIIQGVSTISVEMGELSGQMDEQKEINRRVNEDAGSLVNMSEEIKTSMDDQKHSMDEIVKSITSLNESTQVYSEGALKLSEKSRDLDQVVRELHTMAKSGKD